MLKKLFHSLTLWRQRYVQMSSTRLASRTRCETVGPSTWQVDVGPTVIGRWKCQVDSVCEGHRSVSTLWKVKHKSSWPLYEREQRCMTTGRFCVLTGLGSVETSRCHCCHNQCCCSISNRWNMCY